MGDGVSINKSPVILDGYRGDVSENVIALQPAVTHALNSFF